MTKSHRQIWMTTLLGLTTLGLMGRPAEAGFIVSYEAAKIQQTSVAGAITENFNSAPVGVYTNISNSPSAVGTFTSPGVAIVAANAYGGAGGTGNYLAIGAESGTTSATLKFSGAQSYFGFWWSAADAANSVDLYSGGKYLGSLATAALLNSLDSTYNGNPNSGADASEKFAYLNIYGTSGTTFDQVIFRNSGTGSGFELDNISIASTYSGTTGVVVNGGVVPEPSSLTLLGLGTLLAGGAWRRQVRRSERNALSGL